MNSVVQNNCLSVIRVSEHPSCAVNCKWYQLIKSLNNSKWNGSVLRKKEPSYHFLCKPVLPLIIDASVHISVIKSQCCAEHLSCAAPVPASGLRAVRKQWNEGPDRSGSALFSHHPLLDSVTVLCMLWRLYSRHVLLCCALVVKLVRITFVLSCVVSAFKSS